MWSRKRLGAARGADAAHPEGEQRLFPDCAERAELERAEGVLHAALESARTVDYRPDSPEMHILERAESDHQRARARWHLLLEAGFPWPPRPRRDAVIDLRDEHRH